MTIESAQNQEYKISEKPPLTVQNDIQKDVNKEVQKDVREEAAGVTNPQNDQKLTLAVVTAQQPQQHIEQTAKDQLSKGYLDVRV